MSAVFSSLIDSESRAEFVENYVFDISPTTDESPFFHDHLKLRHLSRIYELVQRKWGFFIQQGYLVPAVFMQVVVIGFILVITPVFFVRRKTKQATGPVLSYFGLIGMGFMFIEISMIQKLILVLEHPTYAVAVVLGSLLVSAGIGSLVGQRFANGPGHLWKITLAISALTGCYIVLIPLWSLFISGGSLLYKAVSVALVLFPLGFMAGMPFPGGIRMLSKLQPDLIPWAWAMNGFFSVLAPALSVMLAMKIGFSGVLWLAAAAYLGLPFPHK